MIVHVGYVDGDRGGVLLPAVHCLLFRARESSVGRFCVLMANDSQDPLRRRIFKWPGTNLRWFQRWQPASFD